MLYLNNPEAIDELIFTIMYGLHEEIKMLQDDTDMMRQKIKELKNKMK